MIRWRWGENWQNTKEKKRKYSVVDARGVASVCSLAEIDNVEAVSSRETCLDARLIRPNGRLAAGATKQKKATLQPAIIQRLGNLLHELLFDLLLRVFFFPKLKSRDSLRRK